MLNTANNTSSARRFGRPAKLVLAAAAAFTLLAGGSAFADESTPSEHPTGQTPAGQPFQSDDNPSIFETETEIETETEAEDSVEVEVEDSVETETETEASETADADQGVHGACVSAVARDESTVGRDHGIAVSDAAHSCPKNADEVSDASDASDEAEDAETDGDKATGAEKSAAGKAKGAEKSAAGKAHKRG